MAKSLFEMTWGEFLDGLAEAGVEVRTSKSGNPFLVRKSGINTYFTALPSDYTREKLVHPWVFDRTCRVLKIDRSLYFEGWYLPL